jgi:hypothetical protein
MIETLNSLNIAAEQLIVRGRRELHGILYANVWCESDDRRYAWDERRVLAVTVAAFPDRVAAADAGKRLWGGSSPRARTSRIPLRRDSSDWDDRHEWGPASDAARATLSEALRKLAGREGTR